MPDDFIIVHLSYCIMRLSSLGDVLLATPLVRMLRMRYPESRIDVVVDKRFADVWRHNPNITTLIELDRDAGLNGILAAKHTARQVLLNETGIKKYDVLIDLQRNLRSMIFRFRLGTCITKVKKFRLQKIGLTLFKRGKDAEPVLIPMRYAAAAKACWVVGLTDYGYGLEFWLPEEVNEELYPPVNYYVNSIFDILNERAPRIAFAPGARYFTKRWPAEKFVELGTMLQREYHAAIVLIGGPDDVEICSEIEAKLPYPSENHAGASLFDSVRIIDGCDFAITNDSAAMHLAAARQTPVVAIFGSTVREFGFEPFRAPHRIAEVELSCRPCSHIGRSSCPKGHFNCMNLVSADSVLELICSFNTTFPGRKNRSRRKS